MTASTYVSTVIPVLVRCSSAAFVHFNRSCHCPAEVRVRYRPARVLPEPDGARCWFGPGQRLAAGQAQPAAYSILGLPSTGSKLYRARPPTSLYAGGTLVRDQYDKAGSTDAVHEMGACGVSIYTVRRTGDC